MDDVERRLWRNTALVILGMSTAIALAVVFWPFESGSHPAEPGRQLFVEHVTIDGLEVPCVVYDSNSDAGAVDCAFEATTTTTSVVPGTGNSGSPGSPGRLAERGPTLDDFLDACAADPTAFRSCPNYPNGTP
jgi:hypothetical protein